jgi:hypothetical protein
MDLGITAIEVMPSLHPDIKEAAMRRLSIVVTVALFALSVTPLIAHASTPSFFNGFETDTNGWFASGAASVNRVASGSPSTSYNVGTTAVYANGVASATGDYNARVTSKVSTGNCHLEPSGSGPPGALRCSGPYTDWGLGFTNAQAFPSGGFTTSLDIYLDDVYAAEHPDCGQNSPCLPNTPGVINPACQTDPSGTNCEGSRFDWDIGVDNPSGGFLQDYVFNVGTAPDPSGQIQGCSTGWIIAASTNSFRPGASPYNLGRDPKCLSGSGWYTFRDVLKDDGSGNLEVDLSILDANGNVVSCTDQTGAASTCNWTLSPGHAITDVGCTEYGWLANEEINDLPIDNSQMDGCGKKQPTIATTLSEAAGITGDSVHDSATLSGETSDAGGTMTYTVYTDSSCSTFANVGSGATLGNAGTKTVSNGSVSDSNAVTFNQAGTYYWQAAYSGDGKNKEATSDCASEKLEIAKQAAKIVETGTTCQQYRDGTAATLNKLTYTVKGTKIGSVTPGVFFYYTKVTGSQGNTVDITESHTGTAPSIPIQKKQVLLYSDPGCATLKWRSLTVNGDGTATGTLPSSGSFIISVKYSASALTGQTPPIPSTSTYSYGTNLNNAPITADIARIDLVKK